MSSIVWAVDGTLSRYNNTSRTTWLLSDRGGLNASSCGPEKTKVFGALFLLKITRINDR